MFFIKVHRSYREVVAICDSELVGQVFEEGQFQLNVKESFYKGDEAQEEEIIRIMSKMTAEDATFNIVGRKTIGLAVDCGLIAEDSIREIQGVPFAMVLL